MAESNMKADPLLSLSPIILYTKKSSARSIIPAAPPHLSLPCGLDASENPGLRLALKSLEHALLRIP